MSEWVSIQRSSWLARARWDAGEGDTGVMLMEAKAGYILEVRDVPESVWQAFLAAPSRGGYYHAVLAAYPKRVI